MQTKNVEPCEKRIKITGGIERPFPPPLFSNILALDGMRNEGRGGGGILISGRKKSSRASYVFYAIFFMTDRKFRRSASDTVTNYKDYVKMYGLELYR